MKQPFSITGITLIYPWNLCNRIFSLCTSLSLSLFPLFPISNLNGSHELGRKDHDDSAFFSAVDAVSRFPSVQNKIF